MKNDFIKKISAIDLEEFISVLKDIGAEFDSEKFKAIVSGTMKYVSGDRSVRESLRHIQELENRWYKSLDSGYPDFSVYNDIYYLADTWVCWKKYSRTYIRNLISKNGSGAGSVKDLIGNISSVADLGNGIGYSTATLKEIFDVKTYGTNLKGTIQWDICERISAISGFKLVESLEEIGSCDLVFASEYFEHFERPVEHLKDVIETLAPRHIIFANTFNSPSIGHFKSYLDGDKSYTGKAISRLFSSTLRGYGFTKVETNFFNNRPNYYRREE